MKCPECGSELRRSKVDPEYGMCDNCKKRFNWVERQKDCPQSKAGVEFKEAENIAPDNNEVASQSALSQMQNDIRIIKYIAMFFCALAIVSMVCMFVMSYQVSKVTASYQKTYEKLFETTGTDSYDY